MPAGSATPPAPLRRRAWALVLTVLISWLLAALAVVAGVAPASAPDTRPLPVATDPQVVLVGIPGLTWDLLGQDTPTLNALAQAGGSAALVPRGIPEVSCAKDAWLTVGAGERAGAGQENCRSAANDRGWDGDGALEPDLSTLTSLAEAGGACVSTYGLSMEDDDGDLRLEVEEGLASGPVLDTGCSIHLVAAPFVYESDRSDSLAGTDEDLAALVGELPAGTTLIVSGMGQTGDLAAAQVIVVAGQEARQGDAEPFTLTSASTRQSGLVQLADLTPTLLELAGVDPPEVGLTERSAASVVGGPEDPAPAAAELSRAITLGNSLIAVVVLSVVSVLLMGLIPGLLLREYRPARVVLALVATTALSFPVGTFLAGLVPWWNSQDPWLLQTVLVLVFAVAITGVSFLISRRWRSLLAMPAVACTITAVVLGLDVLWSARLGMVSVLGVGPVRAGRFYGQGNGGFGILLGALLVLMAAAISWMRHRGQAAAAVVALGVAAVVLGAAPQAGADFGSVPALVVGTGLVLISALGYRWTPRLLLLLVGAATAVAAVVMTLDWLRPPGARTHLGTFVQAMIDGDALGIVLRKLDQSLGILITHPASWIAVVALVAAAVVVLRRPRWSDPLWVEPGVPAVALASVIAMALAWVLNDSGIVTLAMTLTVLIPTAIILLNPVDRPAAASDLSSPEGPAAPEDPAVGWAADADATPGAPGPAGDDHASGTGR